MFLKSVYSDNLFNIAYYCMNFKKFFKIALYVLYIIQLCKV